MGERGGVSCWRKGKEGKMVDGGGGGVSSWRKGKYGSI
jgi:hypothetical protein